MSPDRPQHVSDFAGALARPPRGNRSEHPDVDRLASMAHYALCMHEFDDCARLCHLHDGDMEHTIVAAALDYLTGVLHEDGVAGETLRRRLGMRLEQDHIVDRGELESAPSAVRVVGAWRDPDDVR